MTRYSFVFWAWGRFDLVIFTKSRAAQWGGVDLCWKMMRKIIKKVYTSWIWRCGGSKGADLISFILNIKKDFDYLSFTGQWPNNSERLWSGLQLLSSLFPVFPSSNFTFVLPQIACGNMALNFPSQFHGYNKNEIFADHWDA
jgi:hypothetical protein